MTKLSKTMVVFSFLLFLFLGYSYFVEPNIIQVESPVFDLACLQQNTGDERIVQISDLHFTEKTSERRVEKICTEIEKLQPSSIFITGDLVSKKQGKEAMVEFAKCLSDTAKTYIIFGNWDYDVFGAGTVEFEKELEETGAVVLVDEVAELQLGQEMINLAGIKDIYRTGNPKASLQKVLKQIRDDGEGNCKILLAHTPDIMKEDLVREFDLILAGHTHGGQVYLPFITEEIVLRIIGGKGFAKGRFKTGETWLYVNRGLGGGTLPLRFLSPPEITVLTLK